MKTLALAFLLFSTAAIEVQTGKLADGATQTFHSGSRVVGVYKSGDTTTVRVQEGDRIDTVTLTRNGGKLSMSTKSNGVKRRMFAMDRPPVIVDGIDLEPWLMDAGSATPDITPLPSVPEVPAPAPRNDGKTHFYCPKDGAMLVVPRTEAPGKTYRCPVDGTPMRAGLGPDRQYFLLAPHK